MIAQNRANSDGEMDMTERMRTEGRAAYRSPDLRHYGAMNELTAAGSGIQTEQVSGQGSPNRRP
jgi:hypothetical protein